MGRGRHCRASGRVPGKECKHPDGEGRYSDRRGRAMACEAKFTRSTPPAVRRVGFCVTRRLGGNRAIPLHRLAHAALENNFANVVEAFDMFVGGPGICRNRADAMVGLPYDVEGKSPVLSKVETFSC